MESKVRTILMTVKLAVNFWHFLQGPELLATASRRSQPQRVIQNIHHLQGPELLATASRRSQPQRVIHNIHHLQCGLTPRSVVNGCELPASILPHFRSRSGKG
jgi:hypothetical protein